MSHVDFYYDFSSPFAYLGSTQIEAVAQRAGATLTWKPMLLGGVFRAIGTPMVPFNEAAASKQRYLSTDMERWARHWDVPFQFPTRFPMMTVRPLRMVFLLDDPVPFIHRVFAAYWAEDKDISDPLVLESLCTELGLDPGLVEETNNPEIKKKLIDATNDAIEAGVFGAPTAVVNGQIYWGQDRLHFVEKALLSTP